MVMLDFICIGPAELFGSGREQKNSKGKYMSPAGFEPTPGSPRQVNQRSRPLLKLIWTWNGGYFINAEKEYIWHDICAACIRLKDVLCRPKSNVFSFKNIFWTSDIWPNRTSKHFQLSRNVRAQRHFNVIPTSGVLL